MKHIGVILGATIGPITSIVVPISLGVLIYKLRCRGGVNSNQQTDEKDIVDGGGVGGFEMSGAGTGSRTEDRPCDDGGRNGLIKTLEDLKNGITTAFTEVTYV